MGVRPFHLSSVFARRSYAGCLDLIMGRAMALRGEQDYRESRPTICCLLQTVISFQSTKLTYTLMKINYQLQLIQNKNLPQVC